MVKMTGSQLIANERQRQVDSEGWTPEHDDQHGVEILLLAALCYRDAAGESAAQPTLWPWDAGWWKPKSRQRNLERAGALYQAAADTAERAQAKRTRQRRSEGLLPPIADGLPSDEQ